MTWVRRIAIALCCAILLAGGFVALCALTYWNDMRIDRRQGVSEAAYVTLGGVPQWVQIRGRDRDNPVLLLLNGGPGFSTMDDTYFFREWEKHFTFVMWDQRGEGKSFERSGASVQDTMSIAQLTADGIELAEYLRGRLHKDKIVLLGHSWGSMLGVHMVQARPDLFSVYVGTGQLINEQEAALASYPLLLARARAAGNEIAEQGLLAAGAPPYADDVRNWIPWSLWAQVLDPPSAEKSPPSLSPVWLSIRRRFGPREAAPGITPAVQFSMMSLWPDIVRDDVRALGLRFELPVVFIQGEEDITTVTKLAQEYFDRIDAPSKQFVSLEGAGHLAIYRARTDFLDALNTYVRPLALADGGAAP